MHDPDGAPLADPEEAPVLPVGVPPEFPVGVPPVLPVVVPPVLPVGVPPPRVVVVVVVLVGVVGLIVVVVVDDVDASVDEQEALALDADPAELEAEESLVVGVCNIGSKSRRRYISFTADAVPDP